MNSGKKYIYVHNLKKKHYEYILNYFYISFFYANIRPKGNENKKRVTGLQTPAPLSLIPMQNITSPNKKTHQRSQSDASGLFQTLRRSHSGELCKLICYFIIK